MGEISEGQMLDLRYEDLQFLITLYETQSLTQTAASHGISMGSASRRLAHVREVFDDELFVRSGMTMLPTARMRELVDPIRQLVSQTQLLFVRNRFDLKETTRTVRIASTDNGVATLLNEALGRFYSFAPRAAMTVTQIDGALFERLRSADVDMALYPAQTVPADFHSLEIYRSRLGILVREGHPLCSEYDAKGEMTADMLSRWRSVGISLPGVSQPPEAFGQTAGFTVPYSLAVPDVISRTDFTYCGPIITLKRFTEMKQFRLHVLPAPGEAIFRPHLIWHHSTHTDPFLQWVRGIIVDASRQEAKKLGVMDKSESA